jgi:hypothetical protein
VQHNVRAVSCGGRGSRQARLSVLAWHHRSVQLGHAASQAHAKARGGGSEMTRPGRNARTPPRDARADHRSTLRMIALATVVHMLRSRRFYARVITVVVALRAHRANDPFRRAAASGGQEQPDLTIIGLLAIRDSRCAAVLRTHPRSRAINVPLTGAGSGISRLFTDNRLTRSARSRHTNTSLCKQGVRGSSPLSSTPRFSAGQPLFPGAP